MPSPEGATASEIRRLKRGERGKAWIVAGLIAVVAGAAIVTWISTRPTTCDLFVERACAAAAPTCRAVRVAVRRAKLDDGQCERGSALVTAAEGVAESERAVAVTRAILALVRASDVPDPGVDARAALATLVSAARSADRGALETARGRVLGLPISACVDLLEAWHAADAAGQTALHGVVVGLNQGRDLGADPRAWDGWCAEKAVLSELTSRGT